MALPDQPSEKLILETELGLLEIRNASWRREAQYDPLTRQRASQTIEIVGELDGFTDNDFEDFCYQTVVIQSPADLMGFEAVISSYSYQFCQLDSDGNKMPRVVEMVLSVVGRNAVTMVPDVTDDSPPRDIIRHYDALITRFANNPGYQYSALWDELAHLGVRVRTVVINEIARRHADCLEYEERVARQAEMLKKQRKQEDARAKARQLQELREAQQALADSYDDEDFETPKRKINLD